MSGWGKLSLLFSGFSLIIALGARYIMGGWVAVLYVFLACFALGIIVSLVLDYRFYLEILTAKTTKNSLSLGWSLLLVIVLITALGYFGNRWNHTFDLTEEKINSLSPQSEEALNSLEQDMTVYVFYKGDKISQNGLAVKNELKNSFVLYKRATSKFKTRFLDTYKHNVLSEEYLSALPDKNQQEVFVFVRYKDRKVRVSSPFNEQSLTSALIKVKKRDLKEIYFLVGHGEKDLNDSRPDGLKIFQQAVEDSGFTLKEWSFAQDGEPKTDPALLLIVGSRRPYLVEELNWLKKYLKRGGRVFMALDPGEKHNLQPFLKEYGIDYQNNFILSQLGAAFYGGADKALGVYFKANHPITRRLAKLKKEMAVFSRAGVVDLIPDQKEFEGARLVQTVQASFAVPELKDKVKIGKLSSLTVAVEVKPPAPPEEDGTKKGFDPHDHSKETEESKAKELDPHGHSEKTEESKKKPDKKEKKKQFRLVVFGDSDFLTNRNFYNGVNQDLTLNAVASLTDEEELVTIRPKQPKGTKITLTRNHRLGLVLSMIILPLIFIFTSLWMWYRRREA